MAKETARKAQVLSLDCELAYQVFAGAYERTGELKRAESVYLETFARFPKSWEFAFLLGFLYQRTGWQDPEPFFLRGLALEPHSSLLHYHISALYRSRGDLREAIIHMQTSIDELLPASHHTCEKLMNWVPVLVELYQTAKDKNG